MAITPIFETKSENLAYATSSPNNFYVSLQGDMVPYEVPLDASCVLSFYSITPLLPWVPTHRWAGITTWAYLRRGSSGYSQAHHDSDPTVEGTTRFPPHLTLTTSAIGLMCSIPSRRTSRQARSHLQSCDCPSRLKTLEYPADLLCDNSRYRAICELGIFPLLVALLHSPRDSCRLSSSSMKHTTSLEAMTRTWHG